MRRIAFTAAIAALSFAAGAHAEDFYVPDEIDLYDAIVYAGAGDTIWIAPRIGNYPSYGVLTSLADGVTVVGDGKIRPVFSEIELSNARNVTISFVEVDANSNNGVHLVGSSDITLHRLHIHGATSLGLWAHNCPDLLVRGCVIDLNGTPGDPLEHGVYIAKCPGAEISNCIITRSGNSAIKLIDCDNSLIRYVVAYGGGSFAQVHGGESIDTPIVGVEVRDCVSEHNRLPEGTMRGLWLAGGHDLTIEGLIFLFTDHANPDGWANGAAIQFGNMYGEDGVGIPGYIMHDVLLRYIVVLGHENHCVLFDEDPAGELHHDITFEYGRFLGSQFATETINYKQSDPAARGDTYAHNEYGGATMLAFETATHGPMDFAAWEALTGESGGAWSGPAPAPPSLLDGYSDIDAYVAAAVTGSVTGRSAYARIESLIGAL